MPKAILWISLLEIISACYSSLILMLTCKPRMSLGKILMREIPLSDVSPGFKFGSRTTKSFVVPLCYFGDEFLG